MGETLSRLVEPARFRGHGDSDGSCFETDHLCESESGPAVEI